MYFIKKPIEQVFVLLLTLILFFTALYTTSSLLSSAKLFKFPISSNVLAKQSININGDIDTNEEFPQFTSLEDGERIITIKFKYYGFVKIRLFPEYAPNTVNTFLTHVYNNNYDHVKINRAMNNFIIETQSAQNYDRDNFWGKEEETDLENTEINGYLRNYRGAVGMSNETGQFYIVQEGVKNVVQEGTLSQDYTTKNDAYFELLQSKLKKQFPESIVKKYQEVGGAPYIDMDFVVFGQVIEGMWIIDAISSVEVNQIEAPIKDIEIEYMKVDYYFE